MYIIMCPPLTAIVDDDFMSDMVQTMQEAQKIVQAKCTKRLKEKDQNIL